jgi:cytochrome c
VGNNYAYHDYDYATGATQPGFDTSKPVNDSRNNTGLQSLPPAKPAFIWYPYAASSDFPQVGTGGRNAMAGPVYYTDMYPAETRLPDYYNKKLFIYEWIRGWIKVVTMYPNGDFYKMEPFMEHTKLANLIDMEVGPDGKLYLLEYGTGWFQKNADAGLSRVDYNGGNLSPKVANLKVDKTSGRLPMTITATVDANDVEKDKLTYSWNIGDTKKETTGPRLEYTIDKAGDYAISVDVSDDKKATTKSEIISVYAGNEAPEVAIAVAGNQSFYFPGKPVSYSVKITDRDDNSQADLSNLIVSADYVEGTDKAGANLGHQVLTEAMMGKNLMLSLDCKTCHKESEKSIGPSYVDIAKKYKNDANAVSYLVDKIIKGGGGVWGEVAMAAHPNLEQSDARQIVHWIQSLGEEQKKNKSLPASGTVQPTMGKPAKDNGILYISAAYTDKGAPGIKPLTGYNTYVLRSNNVTFGQVDSISGFRKVERNGNVLMITPTTPGWFALENIDMTSITAATLNVSWRQNPEYGYIIELRLDAPDGKLLASIDHWSQALVKLNGAGGGPEPADSRTTTTFKTKLEPVTDGKMHTLYIVSKPKDAKEQRTISIASIEFK